VPHPGNEQQSQWLSIRRAKPDYVVLRGWGVMNPVALKTAQKVGFPVDHIIGNVWSNSEEDVIPAGDAAKGYVAITIQASGAGIRGVSRVGHRRRCDVSGSECLQPATWRAGCFGDAVRYASHWASLPVMEAAVG
jgi:hypothetical protein